MIREYEYTGNAMGTEFSIALVCDAEECAQTLASHAEAKIQAHEKQFSRFLPESELSLLNARKDALVSESFLNVTEEAKALYSQTQGVFNPLVQIGRLGYHKSFALLDDMRKEKLDEPYNIDFNETRIDFTRKRIVLQEGQKLDFGGFLKGYLAELLCTEMMNASPLVAGAIVNIGGDIHARGRDALGSKFIFHVYNPISKNSDLEVTLYNESLATSGTYKRTWEKDGEKIHHILDANGVENPKTDIVSASVIHERGGSAEAYAKVFLSLGEKEALRILAHEHLSYILIKNNGEIITNTP